MLYDPKKWAMPEVRESDTVEVLKAARSIIENHWCQYGTADAVGVCVITALGDAAHLPNGNDYELARKYFRDAVPLPKTISIPEWNDTPGRTKAEVEAAFDRAIELARADA
jgi:hypothetical protein